MDWLAKLGTQMAGSLFKSQPSTGLQATVFLSLSLNINGYKL